jgi:hypothetical protein
MYIFWNKLVCLYELMRRPHCTNLFKSCFRCCKHNLFLTKRATPMRSSTALRLPLQSVSCTNRHTLTHSHAPSISHTEIHTLTHTHTHTSTHTHKHTHNDLKIPFIVNAYRVLPKLFKNLKCVGMETLFMSTNPKNTKTLS